MKSVNPATAMLLDLFKKKSEAHPGPEYNSGHPYFSAVEAAKLIDVDVNSEKFKETARESMQLWAGLTVATIIGEVINEIAQVGKAAMLAGGDAAKAAAELLTSMEFITNVFQSWANMVDLEHIAESVFADGEKRYAAALAAGHPSADFPEKKMTPAEAVENLKAKLQQALNEKKPVQEEDAAKKNKPPVTPQDIMAMLFESRTKPSVN